MYKSMNIKKADEAAFYEEGRDWEADKDARIAKSESRAWKVAMGATIIAVSLGVALASLFPLRRNIPYLFALDRATGNAEFITAVDDRGVRGYQELIDKHWAEKYVIARESYYYRLLQTDYDTVLALSDDNVGREFAKLYEGPNARDKKYGAGVEMKVTIVSVQLVPNDVGTSAVVRFSKTTRRVDSDSNEPPQYYVATLAYSYKPSMFGKEKDLIANPLGYKVLNYRPDAEMSPVLNTPTPAPVAPSVPALVSNVPNGEPIKVIGQ